MPDFECTWWPDAWYGISLTQCCIEHDLGGTDWQLARCVADLSPAFTGLGLLMFVGLKAFGPIYRVWKKRNN